MLYLYILGTLNPALQDRNGKPKKSVSTIIHILNDLLGASPQYRAQMVQRQQRYHASGRHAERVSRTSHRTASRTSKYFIVPDLLIPDLWIFIIPQRIQELNNTDHKMCLGNSQGRNCDNKS